MDWKALGDAALGAVFGGVVTGAGTVLTFGKSITKLNTKVEGQRGDFLKLGQLVSHIESVMIEHHTNVDIHRNKDFEKRMESLTQAVVTLGEENREEHKAILAEIKNGRNGK